MRQPAINKNVEIRRKIMGTERQYNIVDLVFFFQKSFQLDIRVNISITAFSEIDAAWKKFVSTVGIHVLLNFRIQETRRIHAACNACLFQSWSQDQ